MGRPLFQDVWGIVYRCLVLRGSVKQFAKLNDTEVLPYAKHHRHCRQL